MKKLLLSGVIIFAILAVVGVVAYYRSNSGGSESTSDSLNGAELAALRRALGKVRDESIAASKPMPESISVSELYRRKLFNKPELSGFPGSEVELNLGTVLAFQKQSTNWMMRVTDKKGATTVLMSDGSVQEPLR